MTDEELGRLFRRHVRHAYDQTRRYDAEMAAEVARLEDAGHQITSGDDESGYTLYRTGQPVEIGTVKKGYHIDNVGEDIEFGDPIDDGFPLAELIFEWAWNQTDGGEQMKALLDT